MSGVMADVTDALSLRRTWRMGPPQTASIVVRCKGRLGHLQQTLAAMLQQACSFSYEVIVVDYGCPEHTFGWCTGLDLKSLVAVRVLDRVDRFDRSRAHNCGAVFAGGQVIAFVDADVFLQPTWLEQAARPILLGKAGLSVLHRAGFKRYWDCGGTCAVAADVYHAVRGFDEAPVGWGCEDVDFYQRCRRICESVAYSPNLVKPIRHGHEARTRFHGIRNLAASVSRNRVLLGKRDRCVNPSGYGIAQVDVFCGQREMTELTGDVETTVLARRLPFTRRIHRGVRKSRVGSV